MNNYGAKDMYKHFVKKYPDTEVTYTLYKYVISKFNHKVIEAILEGQTFYPGHLLGRMKIKRVERNFEKKSVNYFETQKLKKQGIDKVVYWTDDHWYRWYWEKAMCKVPNKSVYKFTPTKGNRQKLSKKLKMDEFSFLKLYLMNYKHISSKHVISKIFRDLRINDEGWVLDAMEWIGEALEYIGHVSISERKAQEVTIDSHKAVLPVDLVDIVQVEYAGKPLQYGTSVTGYDLPNAESTTSMSPNGTNGEVYTNAWTTDVNNTSNNQSGLTLRSTRDSVYRGDYYLINNGSIQTSFPKGKIKIHYTAYPTDADGYPMVPDNIYVKQALEWYVLRQMLMGGYNHPLFSWDVADQKWGQYCISAQNDLAFPSIDKVESFKNMWVRLIPNINAHRDFFMGNQSQEQILK